MTKARIFAAALAAGATLAVAAADYDVLVVGAGKHDVGNRLQFLPRITYSEPERGGEFLNSPFRILPVHRWRLAHEMPLGHLLQGCYGIPDARSLFEIASG